MENAKRIKSIQGAHFELVLLELPSGQYMIGTEQHGQTHLSESISDYNTASFLFDLRLKELEGH